jgi:hypothetical protein
VSELLLLGRPGLPVPLLRDLSIVIRISSLVLFKHGLTLASGSMLSTHSTVLR